MSTQLAGETVTCPACERRIGVWRGRIANHKTTIPKFAAAAGEATVWTTVRCNGSMRPIVAALRASLERACDTTGGQQP